jgi:hypothetical protein
VKRGRLVVVGSETEEKLLGGFDRSLRAPLLSLFVSQKLTMLVSTENAADLAVLRDLIEAGTVTPAIDRTSGCPTRRVRSSTWRKGTPAARSSSRSDPSRRTSRWRSGSAPATEGIT